MSADLLDAVVIGASMSPARSLAPAVMTGRLDRLWIHLLAPALGAALAVPLWRLIWSPEEKAHV